MARTVTPAHVMAEVERVMSGPFVWGPCDCCSAACDVFAGLWGFDPMALLRGYVGARGAMRLLAAEGGLAAVAERQAARAGLAPGHAAGGLALSAPRGAMPSLVVCIEPGLWAGKSERGYAILRRVERGWHA